MSYLTDYHLQRRHLTRLCRVLNIPVSEQGPGRKVPRHNNALRVAIFDECLGPCWQDVTNGMNAAQMDQMLGRMVDTMEMRNGFELAAAQACIRAGKHQMRMARADTEFLHDAKGRIRMRPMTHEHRIARMQAASEFYAEARRHQREHEEATRAAEQR